MTAAQMALQWATSHPNRITFIVLTGGWGIYKLLNKALDAIKEITEHGINNQYSFVSPQFSIKSCLDTDDELATEEE